MGLFDRLFAERAAQDTAAIAIAREEARQWLTFAENPCFAKLLAMLDEAAEEPIIVTSGETALAGASRQNALRLTKRYILSRVRWAEQAIASAAEE